MRAPLTVYVELTRDCNLSCGHCLTRREKVEMPEEKARNLLDQLIEKQVFKVYFTGGEPLLYSGLTELLQHIKGRNIWSLIQTNGLLMTEEMAENLKKAGLGACDLPLFGISHKTHDAIAGPGSFEKLLSAIDILNDHKIRSFVSFLVLSTNIEELPRFFDWALKKGIQLSHIRRYIPRRAGDELSPRMDTLVPILREYWRRRDEYDGKGLHYEIEEAFSPPETVDARCPAGVELCSISADGFISPCPYLPVKGESVFEKTFGEVWENSSVLKRARNAEPGEKCRGCTHYNTCKGGCIAAAYAVRGTFEESDPFCLVHPDAI